MSSILSSSSWRDAAIHQLDAIMPEVRKGGV